MVTTQAAASHITLAPDEREGQPVKC